MPLNGLSGTTLLLFMSHCPLSIWILGLKTHVTVLPGNSYFPPLQPQSPSLQASSQPNLWHRYTRSVVIEAIQFYELLALLTVGS